MAGSGKGRVLTLRVKHGLFEHEVKVPSSATVADLKEALVPETKILAKRQKLIFRGKFLLDEDQPLESVGLKDRSKLNMTEDHSQDQPPEVEVADEAPGGAAEAARMTEESRRKVEAVRIEVDKLEHKVVKLRESVEKGEKAVEKEFVIAGELLMRQLLALDSIDVTDESRAQRKAEVNRVQSLVDDVDRLKVVNSRL